MSDTARGAAVDGWMFRSDYVVNAANHGASHHHEAAVHSLAQGVKAGDVESLTRLGKRLLAGDGAPCLPLVELRFLIDAANAGGAEAPAIRAVLSAAGAPVRQSSKDGSAPSCSPLSVTGAQLVGRCACSPSIGPRPRWTARLPISENAFSRSVAAGRALPDARPDMRMKHAGLRPTRGDKGVVSQFVRNRAFVPSGHTT